MNYSTEYSSRIGVENRWEVNYDKWRIYPFSNTTHRQ
jgi:hypothetical protein